MKAIWEPARKYETWLQVELLACEALAKKGLIPSSAVRQIRAKARINPARIEALELVTKHDVIAFIESISEQVGPAARYLHMGLTSSDILDTSLAVLMVEAADAILEDLDRLLAVLRDRAWEHRGTLMIGRSHGIHGEPITFGFKLAIWYDETKRHRERFHTARQGIAYGKVSGAMGTFAHLSPDIEAYVCKKLGLKPAQVSNQIVQRDRHATYLTALALLASSIEKFATEIRHLQRTEVLEVEEPFTPGQKGSSAMPHKRNPIVSENLCGLARLVRANCLASMENVALWHERDISHSSVERVIIPDSTILVDFMLARFKDLMANLVVYPDRMQRNIELTGGVIYSQQLMLELVRQGAPRLQAYEVVQRLAMAAWQGRAPFRDLVEKDLLITRHLSPAAIGTCFDPKAYIRHIPEIFKRVFGSSGKARTTRKRRRA
ncbi:MAG TPA: adenylosuccinate lyase [Nitrospirales bacterium]|nr:adenylosuccinate lyase [Nitrospirales bacterium]